MANLKQVTDASFQEDVLDNGKPVLVDFWAPWCAPCRMIAPIVEDLAQEYEGKVKVAKVDVDDNSGIANRYGIMSIPTLAIFKGGEMVERLVGYMPKPELKRRLERALGATVS